MDPKFQDETIVVNVTSWNNTESERYDKSRPASATTVIRKIDTDTVVGYWGSWSVEYSKSKGSDTVSQHKVDTDS